MKKAKNRGARKARNAQRFADRAYFRRAATDALFAKLEADAALDGILASCDLCGLVQVAPGPRAYWLEPWEQRQGCAVCGSSTGSFVEWLPGHTIDSPDGRFRESAAA